MRWGMDELNGDIWVRYLLEKYRFVYRTTEWPPFSLHMMRSKCRRSFKCSLEVACLRTIELQQCLIGS